MKQILLYQSCALLALVHEELSSYMVEPAEQNDGFEDVQLNLVCYKFAFQCGQACELYLMFNFIIKYFIVLYTFVELSTIKRG